MLRVVTWNVWFDSFMYAQRVTAISNICACLNADVLCFQEVLPPFIGYFREQAWTIDYQFSDYQGATVRPYGVLMLVRKTLLPTFIFHDFPTNMARKLLVANLNLDMGQSFQVGTVHLESLGNPDLRAQQLEISNRVLKAGSSAILCGDFNFCSYRNYSKRLQLLENTHLPTRLPGYVDVWEEIYPACVDRDRQLPSTEDIRTGAASSQADTIIDAGFTFDSETNPMLRNYEQMRYDRIMLRSRRWQAVDIQILGKDPIAFDSKHGIPIAVPSDHYGLVTTLRLVDDTGRRTPDTEEVETTDPFQTPPPSKKCDLL